MKDKKKIEGIILESHGARFSVKIKDSDKIIQAVLKGRLRRHRIRVLPGDKVVMEINDGDNIALITKRL